MTKLIPFLLNSFRVNIWDSFSTKNDNTIPLRIFQKETAPPLWIAWTQRSFCLWSLLDSLWQIPVYCSQKSEFQSNVGIAVSLLFDYQQLSKKHICKVWIKVPIIGFRYTYFLYLWEMLNKGLKNHGGPI